MKGNVDFSQLFSTTHSTQLLKMCEIIIKSIVGIILLSSFSIGDNSDKPLVVQLDNGNKLRGIQLVTLFSKTPFFQFRGIPYAKAPVGPLRFRAPVKYDEIWDEIRDATEFGSMCPQLDPMDYSPTTVSGSEDCLFLNIATPKDYISGEKYPVAVWLHGGAYTFEDGKAYGPEKLLEHPIILVTVNFRLGPLGFANTDDGKIQGNMGLKDQVMALKWVQENIHTFGGDKDQVTLFGVNTGAMSAHLHLISDMSKGLFHRVMLQSGSAFAQWGVTRNPGKQTYIMAKKLLRCNMNETTVYDCLMDASAENLVTYTQGFGEWYIDPLVPFGPSIEKEGSEEKFLTQNPYIAVKSGNFWGSNLPIIMGVTKDEGLLHSADIGNHGILRRVFNWEWHKAAPITLHFRDTSMDLGRVSERIWKYYFWDEEKIKVEEEKLRAKLDAPPSKEEKEEEDFSAIPEYLPQVMEDFIDKTNKFSEMTKMYSDRFFYQPIHYSAKVHAMAGNLVYLYWFEYEGQESVIGLAGHKPMGVAHFDSVQYLFHMSYFNMTENSEEIEFTQRHLKGVAHFIKTGEPLEPWWKPVTEEMSEGKIPLVYNRISKDTHTVMEEPFTDRIKFWESLSLIEYEMASLIESVVTSNSGSSKEPKTEL